MITVITTLENPFCFCHDKNCQLHFSTHHYFFLKKNDIIKKYCFLCIIVQKNKNTTFTVYRQHL
jgi:hypothetical protein